MGNLSRNLRLRRGEKKGPPRRKSSLASQIATLIATELQIASAIAALCAPARNFAMPSRREREMIAESRAFHIYAATYVGAAVMNWSDLIKGCFHGEKEEKNNGANAPRRIEKLERATSLN